MSVIPKTVKRQYILRATSEYSSGWCLDPGSLLEELLIHFDNADLPASVKLTDGTNEVAYGLAVFLSRSYEVEDDIIKFGFKRLSLSGLKVSLIYEVCVDNSVE
jgi:hypothetical protein